MSILHFCMQNPSNDLYVRVIMEKHRLLNRGDVLCDLCRTNPPTDRHHIYTKHSTMGNEKARDIAESPELSALLCRDCHNIADSEVNRNKLFQELYQIHGYEKIKTLHNKLNSTWSYGTLFDLPEIKE